MKERNKCFIVNTLYINDTMLINAKNTAIAYQLIIMDGNFFFKYTWYELPRMNNIVQFSLLGISLMRSWQRYVIGGKYFCFLDCSYVKTQKRNICINRPLQFRVTFKVCQQKLNKAISKTFSLTSPWTRNTDYYFISTNSFYPVEYENMRILKLAIKKKQRFH